ncbi:MAG: 4Fe-4S dicluster domain-containing protein [Deltaproteobacteria bacterium]|jgi:electron transport protein HydN|nr:4Fe-4S dicluster domain-containing protein [Deltaproteobacteria bacterium]
MNFFVKANPSRCIGCRTCMISCVVAHEGKRIFELDPDGYRFNPRLFVVQTARVSAPVHCRQCENPACLSACLSGAIYLDGHRVAINPKNCIGCKNCVMACPFGAMELVETADAQSGGGPRLAASKCDLCAGVSDVPACVKVCLTDALELVTEDGLKENLEKKRRNSIDAAVV